MKVIADTVMTTVLLDGPRGQIKVSLLGNEIYDVIALNEANYEGPKGTYWAKDRQDAINSVESFLKDKYKWHLKS
jgi:hypothetical protein